MDFYQHGPTTLHDLQPERRGHVRALVEKAVVDRPAALLLPMLYSEMKAPAIHGIRDGLQRADYLNELIIPLTADKEEEVTDVERFFSDMPFPVQILWCEGPQVRDVLDTLAERGLDLRTHSGKGLAVWLGIGAASSANHSIAVHDADIESYSPRILHRLLMPLVLEEMDFFFAKGYYARLTNDRLFGRAVRLFVWPFLDALQIVLPKQSPFIHYLRGFRYPLSGEIAITSDLARNLRVPTDWGLELGTLGEVYRNASAKRICQVDLGVYSHKHKEVGSSVSEGLQKMVLDLGTTIYRLLAAAEGVVITPDLLTTLRVSYRREAQDAIRKYASDALANGLNHDRHAEETVVETFEHLVAEAGEAFLREPMADLISEWLRAISADRDSPRKLRAARGLTAKETATLRDAGIADTRTLR